MDTRLKWTISRDSTLLWLAFIGVILTYMKTAGNPRGWDFDHWIEFGMTMIMWGIGKLQASVLPSHDEVKQREADEKAGLEP